MPVDRVQPTIHDEFHAGDEAGDAEHVRRAAFQEIGIIARLRLAGRIAAGAALAPRTDDGRRSDVESTRAGRSQQRLVPGKGKQIDVGRLNVDRQHARGLGRIDEEQHLALTGDSAHLGDRLHRAQDVAAMRQRDQASLRRDRLANGIGIDRAAAVGLETSKRDLAGQFHCS